MAKDNKTWYEDIIGKGVLRSSGMKEFDDANPLDWSRLRVLEDGKFVPAMPKGHSGMPGPIDLQLMRNAAEKGTLFLYRMGEEYPQKLVDGVWYSTDPAAAEEKKPELQVPLGADAAERIRLEKEHKEKVQAWEKRVNLFKNLDSGVLRSIRDEMPVRREEIRLNQEKERAAAIDGQPLVDWYNNEFRAYIVEPSKDPDLQPSDGMDWSRVRIWDGEKFARAVPDGHRGMPTYQMLQNLQDAAEKGNLFMYQRGDKYPSKWMGEQWSSMDKGWIDRCKPEEVKPLPNKPMRPRIMQPNEADYTRDLSTVKLFLNKALGRVRIKVFQEEAEIYARSLEDYRAENEKYERAMAEYREQLEDYEKRTADLKQSYDERMKVYESMLKDYEGLTPKQREAMEKDVLQRAEEIKQNKEIEKQRAEEKLTQELNSKARLADTEARIDLLENQPNPLKFQNRNAVSLGANAYNIVAPHGYELPANSKITPEDVAAIHILLAGSSQVANGGNLSPLNAAQYAQMLDGVLQGNPANVNWQYITASFDATGGLIKNYEGGNPGPLAEALGDGMRNLINVGRNNMEVSPEMAGLAKLAERIFTVLDNHKDLMENCKLKQEEIEFARGLVNLGQLYNKCLDAKIDLVKMSSGAKQLSTEQVSEHTSNLLIGSMTESRLKEERQGLADPKMIVALGKGNGNALDIVQFAYRNNPDIKNFATEPQTLKQTDLDKRTQGLARLFGNTALAKPKESATLREQIRGQVKEMMERNSPQAVEKRRLAEQLETTERQQVRYLLAEGDPLFRTVSLKDDRVTQKLSELREAREVLEKIPARQPDGTFKTEILELTDPKVQQEAIDRASVRELMQRENEALKADGKATKTIDAFTVSRRVAELRTAQKRLSNDQQTYDLTSPDVITKAAENKRARAEIFKKNAEDALLAQSVLVEETGIEVTPALWRSDAVRTRVDQLREARDALGEEGKDLPLNDMRVIQQYYIKIGKDPLKSGIVDVSRLNEAQRKDYDERMQALDYLQNVRGVEGLYKNRDRYHAKVTTAVTNLNKARQNYEEFVEGAEQNLPLNDPRIAAVHMIRLASRNPETSVLPKVRQEDLEKLSRDIRGKDFNEAHKIAKEMSEVIQARNPQIQNAPVQNVPMEPQPPQAPAVQGPPA